MKAMKSITYSEVFFMRRAIAEVEHLQSLSYAKQYEK